MSLPDASGHSSAASPSASSPTSAARAFRPPAPVPPEAPRRTVGFVLAAARNPLEIWSRRAFREPVSRADWLGVPTFTINDPAFIRHCLVDNTRNYAMQPLRQRLLRPILRDGLLTAEGELWRRTRRAMAPVFTPRNILGFAPVMRARTDGFAERLAAQDGETVDLSFQMTLLTYDILQATLFSDDIAGEPQAFARSMERTIAQMGRLDPLDILNAPAFLPRLGRLTARGAQEHLRRVIRATAEKRRALLAADPERAPNDFLTLLLGTDGLSEAEIEDNIVTFIGAGHETTARALGWTLYLLSQAPEERAAVEAEVDALLPELPDPAAWLDRLPRTRAALEEAMRLYPPAPSLNRTAIAADSFGDTGIPAGSTVLFLPWILHRHETLWDAPDEFRPARFLPENRGRIDRFQYLPFGAGPRVCIGASFALQEGVIALAGLVRRLRFHHAGARAPYPVQRITIQPRGGLPMRVERRLR